MCQKRQRRCPALLELREKAFEEWARAETLEEVCAAWGRLGGLTTLHRYGPGHYARLNPRRSCTPERGGRMLLIRDYETETPRGGRCRVRIYEDTTELPVVVCTEPPDNPGMSITNAAEQIAGQVLDAHPDVFDPFSLVSIGGLSYDKPFIWIEHYLDGARGTPQDPATFDVVEFSHYEPRAVLRAGEWGKEIGEPSWSALDRASVEALVGEEVS